MAKKTVVKAKWLASLSNGATAIENIAPFEDIKGELSSWRKFLQYLKINDNLEILSMRIQVTKNDTPTFTLNLPSKASVFNKGKSRRWRRHLDLIDPIDFKYQRWSSGDSAGRETSYIEIQAIYENDIVSIFVDEIEGNECWVERYEMSVG